MKCTKFKNKTEKGITLIALIITIVVLMILAAVAISSITNDGILGYANNAATGYKDAQKVENDFLQEYEDYLTGANKGFKAYDIGDSVTLKDNKNREHDFWVIAESDESQSKVTLMAKQCIIADKTNANYLTQSSSAGTVAFSSDDYWADDESVWSDLNKCTIPEGVTSIVTTAKEYGELFEVTTGRLLTYSEAEDIAPDWSEEFPDDKKVAVTRCDYNYWLGASTALGTALFVYGDYGSISGETIDSHLGVRPVIEISKSSKNIVSVEQ